MYHVPLDVQCIYRCNDEEGDGKEGIEFPGGWERRENANDLVLCRELEEDLRATMEQF